MPHRVLSGSVPAPDSHSSRRSASPERGAPAALAEVYFEDLGGCAGQIAEVIGSKERTVTML